MKTPPPLRPGDTIGIMAPSSRINAADIQEGCDILHARGYKTFVHPQTHEALHQSAGTNEQKRDALHDLVRNPDIKAVLFATGGNRALHLLDKIDYDLIAANPKIYMGFSDNTALLNAIAARSGIVTYHGPTLKRLASNKQIDFNFSFLEGKEKSIPLIGAKVVREGTAQGMLVGGNLSMLCFMEDRDFPSTERPIIFWEDIGEELSRFDRQLCSARRSGVMDEAGALIFGQFTNMLDTGTPFGFTLDDIIAEHTEGLNIPIITNAPFGHDKELNYIMPVGAKVRLKDTLIELC